MRRSIDHQQRISFLSAYLGNEKGTLLLAAANATAFLLCTAMSGESLYVLFALSTLVMQFIRTRVTETYKAAGPETLSAREVKVWEGRALILGGSIASTFGLACLVSFTVVDDSLTRDFVVMLTTANTMGVVARSFGIVRLVRFQLALICIPLASGLLLQGWGWATVVAMFVLPFALITDALARKLRDDLVRVVNERAIAGKMADRFAASLGAIPEALIHLDAEGRVAVMNRAACTLLGVSEPPHGRRFADLVRESAIFDDANTAILNGAAVSGAASTTVGSLAGTLHTVRTVSEDGNTLLILTDITERHRAEQRLVTMARTDSLTGLSARGWLTECGERALGSGKTIALAIVDVDDFKMLNDTLGQRGADGVLCEVASLATAILPKGALAARLGADEFAILACGTDAERLKVHIDELLKRFAERGSEKGVPYSASAGIANGRVGDTVDRILARASIALRAAKADRSLAIARSDVPAPSARPFDDELHHAHEVRLATQALLSKALVTGEGLHIVYQPIIDPRRGTVMGAEALCRWHAEGMGQVSPAVFIPLAEELGAIRRLTDIVLESAIATAATWRSDAKVSVNLSSADVRDDALVARVENALAKGRLHPSRLQLEITEGNAVRDDARTHRTLNALRDMGIAIALDDFGTGYSNLANVERLPIETVKLDRSLIRRIEEGRSFEFVAGAIELFRRLDLVVVVEGVETEAQLERLASIAGDVLVQGFIFGQPMAASMIADLITRAGPQRRIMPRTISVHRATQA